MAVYGEGVYGEGVYGVGGPAGADLTVTASVPKPTVAVSLTAAFTSALTVTASVLKPTVAVLLDPIDTPATIAATIPKPVVAVDLSAAVLGAGVTVAATIPPPTVAVDLTAEFASDLAAAGIIPKPTVAVGLRAASLVTIAATIPVPVVAAELSAVTNALFITGTIPLPLVVVSLDAPRLLPVGTDDTGGIYVGGDGDFDWDPPVAPRPPRLRDPVAEDGAIPAFHSVRDAVAVALPAQTVGLYGQPRFPGPQIARVRGLRPRWVIGSRDVTYWRDVPVGFGGYQKVDPLGYGPTTLLFRSASLAEYPGQQLLGWMRGGAKVRCDWVDDTTDEVILSGSYHGLVLGWDLIDGYWQITVGGQVTGPSALRNAQVQLIRGTSWTSQQVAERFRDLGIPFHPPFGGGEENGFGHKQIRTGGTGHLENLMGLIENSADRDGATRTVMPDEDGVYHLLRRDLTTIHATVYFDNQNVIPELSRHLSEEPNRIYAEATTPTGLRIRFAIYPGLMQGAPPPYPNDDDSTFGEGTEDADTDSGLGVTLLVDRLIILKRLELDDRPDGYDAEVTRAVADFQDYAGLNVTGVVGPNTWAALFDLTTSGYSHRWAKIEPAAQDPRTREWNRSGSGVAISRNPRHDRTILKRDVNYQMGVVKGVNRVREYAATDLHVGHVWTGSIRLKSRAMIRGEHRVGDPAPVPADVMLDVEAWAGMNVLEPRYGPDGEDGDGTLFHVSAVDVEPNTGEVVLTVDTRGRSAPKVWEVMEQRQETRESTQRAYLDLRRSSTQISDDVQPFDKVGGIIFQAQHLTGGTWNVFPVVAGQGGTIRELFVRTTKDTKTAWCMAVFGVAASAEGLAGHLNHVVGDPFVTPPAPAPEPDPDDPDGPDLPADPPETPAWERERVRRDLEDDHYCLGFWGDSAAPCGYWPKNLSRNPDAPVSGKYRDRGGFDYFTPVTDVLWVAIYPQDDCILPTGRIMWPLLGSAS